MCVKWSKSSRNARKIFPKFVAILSESTHSKVRLGTFFNRENTFFFKVPQNLSKSLNWPKGPTKWMNTWESNGSFPPPSVIHYEPQTRSVGYNWISSKKLHYNCEPSGKTIDTARRLVVPVWAWLMGIVRQILLECSRMSLVRQIPLNEPLSSGPSHCLWMV